MGPSAASVSQAAFALELLPAGIDASDPDAPLQVIVGTPDVTGADVAVEQAVRVGGVDRTVTITSSDVAVGELVTTTTTGSAVDVTILPGYSRTPNGVPAGGVAFRPLSGGATTVSVSIPDLFATLNAAQVVTVTESP